MHSSGHEGVATLKGFARRITLLAHTSTLRMNVNEKVDFKIKIHHLIEIMETQISLSLFPFSFPFPPFPTLHR